MRLILCSSKQTLKWHLRGDFIWTEKVFTHLFLPHKVTHDVERQREYYSRVLLGRNARQGLQVTKLNVNEDLLRHLKGKLMTLILPEEPMDSLE